MLSPGHTDSHVETGQNLRAGGQTNSQLAKSRIKETNKQQQQQHAHTDELRSLVSTLVGWPDDEKLAYEFELDQSKRKSQVEHNNNLR